MEPGGRDLHAATEDKPVAAIVSDSLRLGIQELSSHARIRRGQLAGVILTDVDSGSPLDAMHIGDERKPPGELLLPGTIVCEQQNLIWKKTFVNQAQ
jgi:hypothetical protein